MILVPGLFFSTGCPLLDGPGAADMAQQSCRADNGCLTRQGLQTRERLEKAYEWVLPTRLIQQHICLHTDLGKLVGNMPHTSPHLLAH